MAALAYPEFHQTGWARVPGVVDLIAVRKDHGKPLAGTKVGDALQIILI
jgi:hypothetical protein